MRTVADIFISALYMALSSHTCSWARRRLPPTGPCHECVRTMISEANQWPQRLPKSSPVAGRTHTPTRHPRAVLFQQSLNGQRDKCLRNGVELRVTFTLHSSLRWHEVFNLLSAFYVLPLRVTCTACAFHFIIELTVER
jgi:hypothetical protein